MIYVVYECVWGSWIFKCEVSDWDGDCAELLNTADAIVEWIAVEYEEYKDQFPED